MPNLEREPQRRPSEWSRPLLLALILTGAGCAVVYWLLGMPPLLGAEDAAIGFRYVRNLAEGHGIVFNAGGERVEGFTSLSWLFLSAAVYAVFGEPSLEGVLLLISLAMTVAAVAVVFRLLDLARVSVAGMAVAVVWMLGQAGFYFWSGLSLMDVAPWAAGLAAYVLLLDRRIRADGRFGDGARLVGRGERALLAAVIVFLLLTRPEAMLVVPASLVVVAFAYGVGRPFRTLSAEVLAVSVTSIGLLTLWRLAYFGHPLPNTYYAKVAPDVIWRIGRGLAYLGEYLRAHPSSWAAGGVIVGLLVTGSFHIGARAPDRSGRCTATFVAGFVVLGFASVVYGGGDHYQGHRFLQAYLLLATIPLAVGMTLAVGGISEEAASASHRWAGQSTLGLVVVVMLLLLPSEWRTFRDHDLRRQAFDVGLQGRFVGQTLDDAFAGGPKPELGLWMVGGAAYTYRGTVKDLLGLNWTAMGMSPGDRKGPRDHAAFNADVFWSAPPELMVPEPEAVLGASRCVRSVMNGSFGGLLTTQRFHDAFEPVRIKRGSGEPMIAYARSDWVADAPQVVERLGWRHCGFFP